MNYLFSSISNLSAFFTPQIEATNPDLKVVEESQVKDKLIRQFHHCIHAMNVEPSGAKFVFTKPSLIQNSLFSLKAWSLSESGRVNGTFFNLFGGRTFGVAHARGRRPTMEDQHIATSFTLNLEDKTYPVELYGVFDGHGGPFAAEYVKKNLPRKLKETLERFNSQSLSNAGVFNALKLSLVELHKEFEEENDPSGTTATFSVILDQKIWTANVGDSRTFMQNGGFTVPLTEDAKPDDARYRKSIEKRGGQVAIYPLNQSPPRINGILATGRSIGDHSVGPGINPRPKITLISTKNLEEGSRLILTCDGVYDVASTKQVGEAAFKNAHLSAKDLAKSIVYSAYSARSTDNLSALVVDIKPRKSSHMLQRLFVKIFVS